MINLTDLSGKNYILNSDLILKIDSVPETRIILTTGEKYLVKESTENVLEKIIEFRRNIYPEIRRDI